MTRLGAVLLCTVFASVIGCDTGKRLSRLEKENAELKAQVEKDQAARDLDLQAKCSKDARDWFNENWSRDKDTILLDFTNHYNKSSNSCLIFVEFHYSFGPSTSWVNDMSLWNVYENAKYAQFSERIIIDYKNGGSNNVVTCDVDGTKCTSADEFSKLTTPFLTN